ncbi:hypothetical protein PHMEG_00030293 [Phytophthora megakarya]|uniref:Uncharacterized protein n=1 Tax=Phytophthora megakarya TaxID=4795 RepID=A0A225UZ20_9STRA|nr:hypothetical protein PHMEG_00030293 [Phytophthora megakarya]
MTLVLPMLSTTAAVAKKRVLPMSEAVVITADASSSLVAAGHDDDGEEILVEAEPLPHEIAMDPMLRCRYPSKHCLRTRTIKKTGALHSMCAFHRAKANRNQRRLEKRKRLRLNSTGSASDVAAVSPTCRPQMKQEPSTTLSPREVAVEFEPFRTPASLFPEDLDELCELVDVGVWADPSESDFRLLSQFLL